MRIEVVVSGWEQHCCGKAFARSETATVSIVAADPAETEMDAPRRFLEEHHGQTPSDVPQQDVTGTVARITGVSYERRRRPGPHPVVEIGTTRTSSGELDAVAERDTAGFDELRLLLDLADDVDLPEYVVSDETRAARDRAARDHDLALQRRGDPIGVLLDSIADEAVAAYSSVATIERSDDDSAMTIEPRTERAAIISWARYASDDSDSIAVQLGEGRFSFPADVEHASDLRELIASAAAGRVRERVHHGDESTLLETVVESSDGRTWTATITEAPFPLGGGTFLMPGRLAARLRAGDHGYEPWST